MKKTSAKISIVEDNEVVREGFSLLINSMDDFQVVSVFASCEDAIRNLEKNTPDILLMDIDLPGMNGIEGTRRIKKSIPSIDIVVITVHEDSEMVFRHFARVQVATSPKTRIIRACSTPSAKCATEARP